MSFDLVTSFPTLRNAPIVEAAIDFRVERRPDITLSQLEKFGIGLEVEFPKKSERRSLHANVEFKDGDARLVTPSSESDGFAFTSSDGKLVVQISFDGFTLSRLKPYESWSTFRYRAIQLWKRYLAVSRPTHVTRLGVRNINRIATDPGVDLFGVILTGPQIAMALPQTLADFFIRMVIPDPSGSVVVIHETFGPVELGESTQPVIFDIDASRQVQINPEDEVSLWNILEELRTSKNRIFFNSLTAKAIERYR